MVAQNEGTGAEVVRRLQEAFNTRDRDSLLGCLAEDVVWHIEGDHPMAGSYEGRDGLWEGFMGPMWESPARVEVHDVLEHGEHVVVLEEAFHNFGEGEQGWKAVEVFHVAHGQVSERWEFTSNRDELDLFLARGCAADVDASVSAAADESR